MSGSGKILVELPDIPEAATFIYESSFAVVDQWVQPESIFFPGLDENLHTAIDAWVAGLIIISNPAIAGCGSEEEAIRVKKQWEAAFTVIEKIESLRKDKK